MFIQKHSSIQIWHEIIDFYFILKYNIIIIIIYKQLTMKLCLKKYPFKNPLFCTMNCLGSILWYYI